MTSSPTNPLTATPQPAAQTPVKSQKSTGSTASAGSSAANTTSPSGAATPASAPATKSTVNISAAALAALQESRETPAQTAAEARHGDKTAKNIVAKQQARAAQFKTNSR